MIRNISLIPYSGPKDKLKFYAERKNIKHANYYEFYNTALLEEDLPKVNNSKGEPIIHI